MSGGDDQNRTGDAAGGPRVEVRSDGRVIYPETFARYGERYGAEAVTVRSWVRIGKAADHLPPLWDPVAMVSWWRSHRKNAVPKGMLAAAKQAQMEGAAPEFELGEPSAPAGESPAKPAEEPALMEPLHLEVGEYDDPERSLREAVTMGRMAFAEMQKAYAKGNHAGASVYRDDWIKYTQLERQWQKDITPILEERRVLIRQSRLVGVLNGLFGRLKRSFQKALESLHGEMVSACHQVVMEVLREAGVEAEADEVRRRMAEASELLDSRKSHRVCVPFRDSCFASQKRDAFGLHEAVNQSQAA